MRTIFHYFNVLFVLASAIGALIYGEQALSLYLLLAAFQLFSALIILFVKSYDLKSFKEILIYWILVLLYFTIVTTLVASRILTFFIIPIFIAIYHCYVTYKLFKKAHK